MYLRHGNIIRQIVREQDCDGYSASVSDFDARRHPDFGPSYHAASPLFSSGSSCDTWVSAHSRGYEPMTDDDVHAWLVSVGAR